MKTNNEILETIIGKEADHYLNERLKKLLTSTEIDKQKREFFNLKKEVVLSSITGGTQNAELYLKFKSIVADKDYFNIDHVNQLGVEYDILLFLSKKGIGKSYFMIKQLNEWTSDGKSIAFVFRLTDEDIPAFERQIQDYGGEFTMTTKGELISNTQFEPDKKKPEKMVPRYIGRVCGMVTAAKVKGGGYKNLKGIIMDEATDIRKGITKKTFDTFFRSILNSIERETKNAPFIIFGNTDGYESYHPLFSCLGIDPTENLVYIKRQFPGAANETKILYINSRGLYNKGAHMSKMIGAIADPHQVLAAFVNESIFTNSKVSALDLTVFGTPSYAILFKDIDNTKYICKVCTYEIKDPETKEPLTIFFVAVEQFDIVYTYGYTIFSDSKLLYSLYPNDVLYVKDLSRMWIDISWIIILKTTILIGSETETLLAKFLERFCKPKNTIR